MRRWAGEKQNSTNTHRQPAASQAVRSDFEIFQCQASRLMMLQESKQATPSQEESLFRPRRGTALQRCQKKKNRTQRDSRPLKPECPAPNLAPPHVLPCFPFPSPSSLPPPSLYNQTFPTNLLAVKLPQKDNTFSSVPPSASFTSNLFQISFHSSPTAGTLSSHSCTSRS